jgi:hypothetical protein
VYQRCDEDVISHAIITALLATLSLFRCTVQLARFNDLHLELTEIVLDIFLDCGIFPPRGEEVSLHRGGTQPPPWGEGLSLKGWDDLSQGKGLPLGGLTKDSPNGNWSDLHQWGKPHIRALVLCFGSPIGPLYDDLGILGEKTGGPRLGSPGHTHQVAEVLHGLGGSLQVPLYCPASGGTIAG